MIIAVEGCAHGELDTIYETIQAIENERQIKVDLLLCCGDFQSIRNFTDLKSMAVPEKFQHLNTFYKYYSGEKTAPVLTVFVGGNHEASNYLAELPFGGWVAPNIYYMGFAGVINFGGLRIGGLSGIYKGHDYLKGHYEAPPYQSDTLRSAYHIRNLEVFRLKQTTRPIDIFLSHDWPQGVTNIQTPPKDVEIVADVDKLLRIKKHFYDDVSSNKLGSRPSWDLLHHLRPKYWFAAHLHVKFPALIKHKESGTVTKFLALDKVIPRRDFLQILELVPSSEGTPSPKKLSYDAEWLAILKNTDYLMKISRGVEYMPTGSCDSDTRSDHRPTEEEVLDILESFSDYGEELIIPESFTQTAPPHRGNDSKKSCPPPLLYENPQTVQLCSRVNCEDWFQRLKKGLGRDFVVLQPSCSSLQDTSSAKEEGVIESNPDEISLDEDDEESKIIENKDIQEDLMPPVGFSLQSLEEQEGTTSETGSQQLSEDAVLDGCAAKKFKRRNASIYASQDD